MKNAFFSGWSLGGQEVTPKSLSLLLILITIKHATLVTTWAIIGINAPFINVPPVPAGRLVITPTAVPFAIVLSHILLLTPPRPPHNDHQDLLVVPRFLPLLLVALIRRTPGLIVHVTETALLFPTKTISTSMKTSQVTESLTAWAGVTLLDPLAGLTRDTFKPSS